MIFQYFKSLINTVLFPPC